MALDLRLACTLNTAVVLRRSVIDGGRRWRRFYRRRNVFRFRRCTLRAENPAADIRV